MSPSAEKSAGATALSCSVRSPSRPNSTAGSPNDHNEADSATKAVRWFPSAKGCTRKMPAYRAPTTRVCSRTLALRRRVNRSMALLNEPQIPSRSRRRVSGERPSSWRIPPAAVTAPKECSLLAQATAIMRKVARKDRAVPPTDALGVEAERLAPESPQRIGQDAGQLIPESQPGLLRRKTTGPVETRTLVVAVTRMLRFLHPSRMPLDPDSIRLGDRSLSGSAFPGTTANRATESPAG